MNIDAPTKYLQISSIQQYHKESYTGIVIYSRNVSLMQHM